MFFYVFARKGCFCGDEEGKKKKEEGKDEKEKSKRKKKPYKKVAKGKTHPEPGVVPHDHFPEERRVDDAQRRPPRHSSPGRVKGAVSGSEEVEEEVEVDVRPPPPP